MLVPLCFGKYAVFPLTLGFNAHPMLRQTAEHIFAFADVDNLTVDADLVNARMLELFCPSSAF